MLKAILFLALFVSFLSANDALLNFLKQESLNLDRQKSKEEASKLRLEWVSPLNLTYQESYNNDIEPAKRIKGVSVILSQPFFRSGGIIYAIKYANKFEKLNELLVDIKEKELKKSVIFLIYSLRKIELLQKKQELLIANVDIDIERKRELFNHGLLDSNTLDRALLDKNQYTMQLLELESQKSELLKNLKDISDVDYKSIALPIFEKISKEEYLANNMELKRANIFSEQQRFRKNAFITSFLPTVALNIKYNKQYGEIGFNKEYWNDYTTIGISASMPLFDINMPSKIESYRIDYLKAALEIKEKELSELNNYENILRQVDIIQNKLEISKKDEELYEELLKDAKDRLNAGETTKLDIQTLKNSKDIKSLDKQIFFIEKQLKLLELYARVNNGAF